MTRTLIIAALLLVPVLLIGHPAAPQPQRLQSWNLQFDATPKLMRLSDIMKLTKLDGNGQGSEDCCPSPERLVWKRALPARWRADQSKMNYFVQVNRLVVVDVGEPGDRCVDRNLDFYDRHVTVKEVGQDQSFIVEFDRCWADQNLINSLAVPPPSSVIDVQGFATWDTERWEIHPVTAWRFTQ